MSCNALTSSSLYPLTRCAANLFSWWDVAGYMTDDAGVLKRIKAKSYRNQRISENRVKFA